MGMSERDNMAAGEWYSCLDPELDGLRDAARIAVHSHNTMHPGERSSMAPLFSWLAGFQISLISAAEAVVPGWSRWIPPRFADEFAPRSLDRLASHTARRYR